MLCLETMEQEIHFISASKWNLRANNRNHLFKGQKVKYDRKSLLALRKQVGIVFQDPDSQLFSW